MGVVHWSGCLGVVGEQNVSIYVIYISIYTSEKRNEGQQNNNSYRRTKVGCLISRTWMTMSPGAAFPVFGFVGLVLAVFWPRGGVDV